MVKVVLESVKRTKNTINGFFKLSDKTRTRFHIDRTGYWEQWGNFRDNLSITVERVEQLQQELVNQ